MKKSGDTWIRASQAPSPLSATQDLSSVPVKASARSPALFRWTSRPKMEKGASANEFCMNYDRRRLEVNADNHLQTSTNIETANIKHQQTTCEIAWPCFWGTHTLQTLCDHILRCITENSSQELLKGHVCLFATLSTNSISQCQTQKDVKKLQLYTCNFALLCPGLQYQLSNHVISMGGITVYGIMSSPLQIQDNYIRLESLECTLHSPLSFSLSFETMVQRGPQNLCGRFCSFSTGYMICTSSRGNS